MDTSMGLSSIATLSLGLSMSMAGAGRAVITQMTGECRQGLKTIFPAGMPAPKRPPGRTKRNSLVAGLLQQVASQSRLIEVTTATKSPDASRKPSREILWKMERVPEESKSDKGEDDTEVYGRGRGAKRRMEGRNITDKESLLDVIPLVHTDDTAKEMRSYSISNMMEGARTKKDYGITSGTTLIPDVIIHAAEAWASTDSTPLIDTSSSQSELDEHTSRQTSNSLMTSEQQEDQAKVSAVAHAVALSTAGSSSLPQLSLQDDNEEPKTKAKMSSPLKIGNYSLNALNNNCPVEVFGTEISRFVNVQDLDQLQTSSVDCFTKQPGSTASEEDRLVGGSNCRPQAPSYSSFVNRRTKSNESNAYQNLHEDHRDLLYGELPNSCGNHFGTQDERGLEFSSNVEHYGDGKCSTVVSIPAVGSGTVLVDSLGNYTVRVIDSQSGTSRSSRKDDIAHTVRPRRRLVGCGWSKSQELVDLSKSPGENLAASRRRKMSLSLRIPKR